MTNNKIAPIVLVVIAVIVAIVVMNLYKKDQVAPVVTPTPTATQTSTVTPKPTPAPTATVPPSGSVNIIQTDTGKTFVMKVGSTFVLKLGDIQNWNVNITDPSVIQVVPTFAKIPGAQGMYIVRKAGTAIISAEGRPVCKAGEMCAQYIINFNVTIKAN